jgi:hypothetical protein
MELRWLTDHGEGSDPFPPGELSNRLANIHQTLDTNSSVNKIINFKIPYIYVNSHIDYNSSKR